MSRTVERASNSDAGTRPSRLPAFHAVAWRWHFYAGLYVVPFLLMLAITGAVMVFFTGFQTRLGFPVRVTPQAESAGRAASVRVQTTSVVDEPVLTVTLTAGCAGKVTRSYTFLADPPARLPPVAAGQLPAVPAALPGTLGAGASGLAGASSQAAGADKVENALQVLGGALVNNLQVGGSDIAFDLLFSMLEQAGISRTLSRPNLTVLAGEKAGSKLAKAEQLNVPVMDEAAFVEFLAAHGVDVGLFE